MPALQAGVPGVVALRRRRAAGRPPPGAGQLRRPGAATTGLVAYLDGEPVGWCAVEPRSAYMGLARTFRVPWDGRSEDEADDACGR